MTAAPPMNLDYRCRNITQRLRLDQVLPLTGITGVVTHPHSAPLPIETLSASGGIRTHDSSNVLFCLKHFTNSATEVLVKIWEKIQEYLISFFTCSMMFASNLQGFHLRVENFFKLLELFMILAWKIEQFNRA